MKFLSGSTVRMTLLLGVIALAWGCAAPAVKPLPERTVKEEIRKEEKTQVKAPRKRKPKKRNVKKVVQPEMIEASKPVADAVEELLPEEDAPRVVGRMMFHYEYYPDVEVYFDTIRHLYFYQDKGRWTMSVALPTTYQENLGRSFRLKIENDRPYEEHTEHLRLYPPAAGKPEF